MTPILRTLTIAGALLAPTMAFAQTPADATAAHVQAGTYAVEPNHTQVAFGVSHMGFTPYYGRFANATGSLTLSPTDAKKIAVQISVPVDTVSTTSEKLDGELKGDKWLDAAKFPQMTFKSTNVKETGANTADVTGDLMLHGVTKPVVLHVHFVGAGVNPLNKHYTAGFTATGTIKRSEFGVNTYVPLIGDDVTLMLTGAFEHQD